MYRDGELVVKWDLDNQKAMKGAATRRILRPIRELEAEGREAFTYVLHSGRTGTVHVEQVLEYNQDPTYASARA